MLGDAIEVQLGLEHKKL